MGALAQVAPQPVDEIAPPSQIPGLNLTQFNNIGNFRPNVAQHIPRPSTRACRTRNLFNWSSDQLSCLPPQKSIQTKLFSTWHELSSVIPSSPHECDKHLHMCWSLIATALHTMWHWSKITELPKKVWRLLFVGQTLWSKIGVKFFPLYISTLFWSFLHLSWWRPLVWGWN